MEMLRKPSLPRLLWEMLAFVLTVGIMTAWYWMRQNISAESMRLEPIDQWWTFFGASRWINLIAVIVWAIATLKQLREVYVPFEDGSGYQPISGVGIAVVMLTELVLALVAAFAIGNYLEQGIAWWFWVVLLIGVGMTAGVLHYKHHRGIEVILIASLATGFLFGPLIAIGVLAVAWILEMICGLLYEEVTEVFGW